MNQLQAQRIFMEEENFQRSILGEARGEFREFEEKAMPLAEALMPIGPAALRQVMIRLIAFYLNDARALVDYIIPRHIEIVQSYGFSPESNKDRAEGLSAFWLFRSTNPALQAMEVGFGPGVLKAMVPGVHAVYAIRAFLRIQALFLEIDQVEKIVEIRDLYLENVPEDLLPTSAIGRVDIENFEPVGKGVEDADVAGSAPRRLDA